MAIVLAYPYADFRISAPITTASDLAALRAATAANWSSAALAGDSVTVATIAETCHQINDVVQNFTPRTTYAQLDETTLADEAVVTRQGRPTWEATVRFLHDDDSDGAYDLLVKQPAGVRMLYVERAAGSTATGSILAGLVTITDVSDQGVDADGQGVTEVTLRNAARVAPVWT